MATFYSAVFSGFFGEDIKEYSSIGVAERPPEIWLALHSNSLTVVSLGVGMFIDVGDYY